MTIAVGCASRPVTPEVVVRLLDHPRFQLMRPIRFAMEPVSTDPIATRSHRGLGKTKHVPPLVLIGTGALNLAILADLYLRFLS